MPPLLQPTYLTLFPEKHRENEAPAALDRHADVAEVVSACRRRLSIAPGNAGSLLYADGGKSRKPLVASTPELCRALSLTCNAGGVGGACARALAQRDQGCACCASQAGGAAPGAGSAPQCTAAARDIAGPPRSRSLHLIRPPAPAGHGHAHGRPLWSLPHLPLYPFNTIISLCVQQRCGPAWL